jgi:DeoR/GlpR family transcriptional regulator of sugar metabolism
MIRIERQAKILEIIRERSYVENSELARTFDVTLATIRRDLTTLQEQGLVRMDHGGTSLAAQSGHLVEPDYDTKIFVNYEAKKAIGKAAAAMVRDGDAIILDSGTTNAMIAKNLRGTRLKNLTVITCDIMVAKELGSEQNINVVVLGGQLRKSYFTTYGPYTEYILKNIRANKYFFGIDAANKEGVTNIVLEEVPIKQQMIAVSECVIMVADSTKFEKTAAHRVCDWASIGQVITDSCIHPDYLGFFQQHHISIETVDFCSDSEN